MASRPMIGSKLAKSTRQVAAANTSPFDTTDNTGILPKLSQSKIIFKQPKTADKAVRGGTAASQMTQIRKVRGTDTVIDLDKEEVVA